MDRDKLPALTRTREAEIGVAVMRFLVTLPTGSTSIRTIKRALPAYLSLSAIDRAPSPSRPTEERWEQRVRNLVSHRKLRGNPICEGLLEYGTRHLAITDKGRDYLAALMGEQDNEAREADVEAPAVIDMPVAPSEPSNIDCDYEVLPLPRPSILRRILGYFGRREHA